jgi:hypothetical protein
MFVFTKTGGTFKESRANNITLEPNRYETFHENFYFGDEWLPVGVDQVKKNNVFEIECTFTSDTDLPDLGFIIVDSSTTARAAYGGTNNYISKSVDIATNIVAGTPVTKTITITATAGASSNKPDANRLYISTSLGGGDDITLTFTAWKVTKKKK